MTRKANRWSKARRAKHSAIMKAHYASKRMGTSHGVRRISWTMLQQTCQCTEPCVISYCFEPTTGDTPEHRYAFEIVRTCHTHRKIYDAFELYNTLKHRMAVMAADQMYGKPL